MRIEELSEDCTHEEGAENILVSLMQNHETRNRSSQKNFMIGFYVFKVSIDRCSSAGFTFQRDLGEF